MKPLFYFLLAIPVIEILVLVELGAYLSGYSIVLLIICTAAIGLFLVRRAGLHTLTKGRDKLSKGELPQAEVLEGLLLIIAGALLLTPGLITDSIGFLILVPSLRKAVAMYSLRKIAPFIIKPNPSRDGTTQWQTKTTIIESEFKDLDPQNNVVQDQLEDNNR